MTRILFVGDLHAKPQLLPRISRTADRVRATRIILLGDIMDDWTATGRSLVEWAETFCDWVEAERQKRQVTMLIGNHDVPYLLEADTPEYARVRDYGTPGFHAKAQRKVFAILSGRLHELSTVWHDGHVLASHAGFTGSWLNGWPYGQPNTPISISLMFPGEPSKLASAYCQAGAARGGDSAPSPLWADKSELITFTRDPANPYCHISKYRRTEHGLEDLGRDDRFDFSGMSTHGVVGRISGCLVGV